MKVLTYIICLVSLSAYAKYDPSKLNKDIELIENELIPLQTISDHKILKTKKKLRNTISAQEEIKDLESLYFDKIKTQAAGRLRNSQRKRQRSRSR